MNDTSQEDRVEKALQNLVRWLEVWNRVCDAAQGNDDGPPPEWLEVVKTELPDWNIGTMSADGWDAYMSQTLYHHVEGYLFAMGRHPTHSLTSQNAQTPSLQDSEA